MSITATSTRQGQDLTIAIEGRFDFNSLQKFRKAYEEKAVRPKTYIVDLKNTDYLDSSALGMLLALRDHAKEEGAALKVVNCKPDVKKILTITKLNELFSVE
jgi:anti-anti-sigma factor